MRTIPASQIADAVAALLVQACIELPPDVEQALRDGRAAESLPHAQAIMDTLLENAAIARKTRLPLCQDTGVAFVLVELGAAAHVADGVLTDAVQEGIRAGSARGHLRRSIVRSPLQRVGLYGGAL